MNKIEKHPCQLCDKEFEYDAYTVGTEAQCPHCGLKLIVVAPDEELLNEMINQMMLDVLGWDLEEEYD
jgi:DNA-directed RNA polymerase subunit RPC12/RpoP